MDENNETVCAAFSEGEQAFTWYADIFNNPYARGTEEFDAWREGWAHAEHATWLAVLLAFRLSTDKHRQHKPRGS